ncbi:MAG: response regulator [Rhodocyclaceae bacterium]
MTEVAAQLPRILIVDDSRMVRASLIKQIRDKFDVREEVDGEAGWQSLLLDPTIEVVISDIGMPRLDGFGLLQRIRGSRLARVELLARPDHFGRRRKRSPHARPGAWRHRFHYQGHATRRTAGASRSPCQAGADPSRTRTEP